MHAFHNFYSSKPTACVNPHGNDCPYALKLIACVLLYEITSFLRETYQTLPKTSKLSHKDKPAPWDKVYREANRRWSMALSSMGHSQTSAQSLQSIAGGGERNLYAEWFEFIQNANIVYQQGRKLKGKFRLFYTNRIMNRKIVAIQQ